MHCDHLIQATVGADVDLQRRARHERARSTTSCASVSAKYGIGFWKPGCGHHPPGRARELRVPRRDDDRHRQPHAERRRPRHGRDRRRRRRRGRRDGRLPVQRARARSSSACTSPARSSGWAAPKDVILKVAEHPHRQGRHRRDRRVLRPGRRVDLAPPARPRSATWAPRSAPPARSSPTTPTWPRYLKATGREAIADARRRASPSTCADDPEVDADPERFFDQVIEIDLVDARAAHRRPAHPRPRPPGLARSAPTPSARATRSRSRPRSSARAPTRRTRTSPAPRTSPARPRRTGLRVKTPAADHARLRAGARHHRARRPARRPRGDRRAPCSPTRAGRASASGSATDIDDGRSATRSSLVQPQLPEAQRRQRGNTLSFVDVARDGHRAGARRHASTSTPCTDTLTDADGDEVRLEPPVGRRAARRRASTPASPGSWPRRPTARGVEVVVDPTRDRLAAARAVPGVGRQRLSSTCRCC